MYSKKLAVVVMLILAVAMVITSCAPAEKLATELNLNHGTEPPTLDPSLTTDTTSVLCTYNMFMGLTNLSKEDMQPVPHLATKWDISDDGLVYTFHMRKDVKWVQWDPATQKATEKRPVVAGDIEYSVKRVCNPETASDYAYVNYIIKGCEAVNTGETTDLDSIGVKALDDYTVEITLVQPAAYFPAIASMWTAYPLPREAIEEYGDLWTEPGNIWTHGPYVLDVWEHENRMVWKKNPLWFDAKNVKIETVNFVMVTEASTAMAMYENGELDVTGAPMADLDRIRADAVLSKELVTMPRLCQYYYGYNTTKPPFDNVKVRQAFSYAVDRQKLIDTVTKGGQTPAWSFAPEGIFGEVATNPDFPGITFDCEKAKSLLAEAGYPNGEGLPDITLMFNTSEGHQAIAEFIQRNWKECLGVEVKLANQEWAVYLNTVHEDSPQVWRMGWCADYSDQNNWVLEVWHPLKGRNDAKWDPESPGAQRFMEVTEAAALETDPDKRKELYFEAEKILCADEAVQIPIYYYTRLTMVKPYLERTFDPAGGNEEIWTWKVKAH
jgi:oligopeptide transport system substrate-binding protein